MFLCGIYLWNTWRSYECIVWLDSNELRTCVCSCCGSLVEQLAAAAGRLLPNVGSDQVAGAAIDHTPCVHSFHLLAPPFPRSRNSRSTGLLRVLLGFASGIYSSGQPVKWTAYYISGKQRRWRWLSKQPSNQSRSCLLTGEACEYPVYQVVRTLQGKTWQCSKRSTREQDIPGLWMILWTMLWGSDVIFRSSTWHNERCAKRDLRQGRQCASPTGEPQSLMTPILNTLTSGIWWRWQVWNTSPHSLQDGRSCDRQERM